ncbi:Rho termination factor N-terminal domain-containing protein [Micromonospora sp. NPDC093277]|uniref:Rho termination factor N-terminal domain-containing protein n=1 Tax=Micromonospora sp. NPDC093277 TaxID=3364291 RepID=UPI00381EF425
MTELTRTLLGRVAEFLAGLSAAEVAALAEGRARLALLPAADSPVAAGRRPAAAEPVPRAASPAPAGVDVEGAHAALAAMSRRDEGTAYLASWTTRQLRALAARAGLRGVAGLRKAELVERIVDRTIGFRLNSTAVRQR